MIFQNSTTMVAGRELTYFHEITIFSDLQLEKQVEHQAGFLSAIYPFLLEDSWHDGTVELRPIPRGPNCKYLKSYNCWRLGSKDKKELYDFLKKGINGKTYCLY